MIDYSTHDPKGWCGDPKRGAALGRPMIKGPRDYAGKIYVRRSYLDQGGYDRNGTYFGHGQPLYWYASEGGEIDGMVRADSRKSARFQVLGKYPQARIRR